VSADKPEPPIGDAGAGSAPGEMPGMDARLGALRARARREILAMIWDRELPAGQIAAAFSLKAATISEHLAVLRAAGLVSVARAGTSRLYRARPEALAGLHGALEGITKWQPATHIPERALATTATIPAVTASVVVATDPDTTFTAFTDARLYSRWLQVPVTITPDGRFAATMEWGTEVRGRYEYTARPHLIVMSWDFDDDNVPVPGRPLTGYLRITAEPGPAGPGSRVQVHQLTESAEQVAFMEAAWGMVLGRLAANLTASLDQADGPPPRRRRDKAG
jgi:uncharacterized protein YndB with AHSA1/START domain/DNA-binding transcriptional ArsR family regulator